jgi:adenosylhomocysteine nucleosidase
MNMPDLSRVLMGGFSGTINEGTVWRMNTTKHIGIVVALPEERVALVKKLQKVKRRLVDGIPFYTGTLEGRLVSVVEGGMGTTAASHAARLLIAADRPNLLLSAGFCGAIRPGVRVADLVICKRIFQADDSGLHEVRLPGSDLIAGRLSAELQSKGLRTWQGSFITTSQIVTKAALAETLPDNLATPVLEMESSAIAQTATAAGIAFLGLRAVSDDAAEELDFTLDELTDKQLRISIPRVLLACLKKPRIIPQLARLAGNSGKAGKNLGTALQQIIKLL